MVETLEIPQEILDSARLTVDEAKLELALALYAQGRLSAGKARELAGISLWQFRQLLAARRIPVHMTVAELESEIVDLQEAGDL